MLCVGLLHHHLFTVHNIDALLQLQQALACEVIDGRIGLLNGVLCIAN